ncbi:MAG: alpha/beta fold hydrolase [Oscillospiraceae bacterium]|nr:alpha/beta fold hydrolase [Oscillospiraceae bacterium]
MSRIKKTGFEIDSQGCKLRGFILHPERPGRLPTVIVSHGFGSCTRDTKKYARVFVDEGYAAICVDFCMSGSGKSSGSSLGMSVLTEKTDLLNVLDYVKTLDFVDADHIILAGCSQGGFVSALAAAERESEVERLIMYYPALCIPDDARRGQMINAKFDPEHIPDQFRALFVKLSSRYVLDVIGMEPYQEICGFQKPVLIVHGTKDKLVDISYSRRACEGYRDCQLVEVNGDHGFVFSGFAHSKRATVEYLRSCRV